MRLKVKQCRHLVLEGKKVGSEAWKKVRLIRTATIEKINRNGTKKIVRYKVGIARVRLPDKGYRNKNLWLLVMKKIGPNIGKDDGFSFFLANLKEGIR